MRSFTTKENTGLTVDLPGGGKLHCRPVTEMSFTAAKSAARKLLAALLADKEALKALGVDPETDLENKDLLEGLGKGLLILELGARHITSWESVADETGEKEADLTRDNVRKLLKNPMAAHAFYEQVLVSLMPEIVLKKDLGTAAAGTSPAVPPIAEDAEIQERPAQTPCPASTDSSAPISPTA